MRPPPDTQPLIEYWQHHLVRGLPWTADGRDTDQGLDCYGLVQVSYGLIGILLPDTAEDAERSFRVVLPPYQAWDVAVFRLPDTVVPRHLGLLMDRYWGFQCTTMTNGLSRFTLGTRNVWSRLLTRVLRFEEFAACA